LPTRYKLTVDDDAAALGAATGHTARLQNRAMNSVVSFDHLVGAYPNRSWHFVVRH
jgi:hypothetical protein